MPLFVPLTHFFKVTLASHLNSSNSPQISIISEWSVMTLGVMVSHLCPLSPHSRHRCHVTGTEADSQLIRHRVAVRHGTGDTLRCTELYSVHCTTVQSWPLVMYTLTRSGDSYSPGHSRGEERDTRLDIYRSLSHKKSFPWQFNKPILLFWVCPLCLWLQGTEHRTSEHCH